MQRITKKDLFDLLSRLAGEYRVLVPYRTGERLWFGDFDSAKEAAIDLGGIRQDGPFKTFLMPPREKVMGQMGERPLPLLVAGVKACDLTGLAVQDHVFLRGDVEDPFYARNRAATFIIAADCTQAKETCFCTALGGGPYPRTAFDLAIADVGDAFVVEIGSDRGGAFIERFRTFFRECAPADEGARATRRAAVTGAVREFVAHRGMPQADELAGAVAKAHAAIPMWEDHASTCVECGACNLVCPTCHCFLLYDEKPKTGPERYRIGDACLYKSFARVAGGANPRRHLYERLRNRIDKKFAFFPATAGIIACTGCGRCIDACAGAIDIREILKGLVKGIWNKPPHE